MAATHGMGLDESDDHMGREMGGPRQVRHPLAQHLYKLASELEQVGMDTARLEDGIEDAEPVVMFGDDTHYPFPFARTYGTSPDARQPTAALALMQVAHFLEQLHRNTGREPVLLALNIAVDGQGRFRATFTVEQDNE